MKRGSSIVVVTLLLTAGAVVIWPPPSARASSPPLAQVCSNSPSNPVLNDSGAYGSGSSFMYNNTYFQPAVLKVGGVYWMWFNGYLNREYGLYRATSPNGVNWTVSASMVLPAGVKGSWDYSGPFGPSVLWNGTRYLMYFWGDNGNVQTRSIGVATSRDGVHWTEYASNPILAPGPSFYDRGYIKDPDVIFSNGSYMMWYKGRSSLSNSTLVVGIDAATSPDGLHWTKYQGNPVVGYTNASSLQKDLIFQKPSVVKVGGGYLMAADDNTQIGYASSSDGLHWRIADSWLVRPTNDTAWSGEEAFGPTLLLNGTTLLLWYTGSSQQTSSYKSGVGLATCALLVFQSSVTLTQTTTQISTKTVTTTSIRTEAFGTTVTTYVETPSATSTTLEVAAISAFVFAATALTFVAFKLLGRRRI